MTMGWRALAKREIEEPTGFASYKDKFMHLLIKRTDIDCWVLDLGSKTAPLHTYASFGWYDPKDITKKRKTYIGRRVSYEMFIGAIPDLRDNVLTTTCGNLGCVNPEHLKSLTRGEISKVSRNKDYGTFKKCRSKKET